MNCLRQIRILPALIIPGLIAVSATHTTAQTPAVVVPSGLATEDADGRLLLLDVLSRVQFGYAASELSIGAGATTWTEIAFRPDAIFGQAASTTLSIRIASRGVPSPDAMNGRDAGANLGIQPTSVFGPAFVSLPATSVTGSGASNPWVAFPFRAPFRYVAGEHLVVEVSVASSPAFRYVVDAVEAPQQSWVLDSTPFGFDCGGGTRTDYVGSVRDGVFLEFRYEVPPIAGVSGALFALGSTGSFGGVPTPVPLDSIGAVGCALLVVPEFVIPAVVANTGPGADVFGVTIPLRRDRSLIGQQFASQFYVLDSTANSLGVTTSAGAEHTIASGPPPCADALYSSLRTGSGASTFPIRSR